jgi:phosphoglycolate phosphatase-like HAD superfamily hydrolase
MRYPVLIFDLDDTLIESFPEYVRMHQRIAGELGWSVPSAHELVHYGPTWEDTLARLWPNTALDPFFARYEQLADEHRYPAIAGVPEALGLLRERGHTLWIVTKRSRARLVQRMDQAGLARELFAGIFAVEDQPIAKPHPRCFEPVWAALGAGLLDSALRERALYVGDREDDHIAAREAGLGFVGVRTGPEHHTRTHDSSWLDALPDEHVLDSAAQLPTWLEARA